VKRGERSALWIAGGLALAAWLESRPSSRTFPLDVWGGGWMWPVPDYVTAPSLRVAAVRYPAVITQEYKPGVHEGVDIMYRRRSLDDASNWPAGTTNGTRQFFAPPGTQIVAAKAGRVWFAGELATGGAVLLDHGAPWLTGYYHLETLAIGVHAGGFVQGTKTVTNVAAGDVLGTMGWNPNNDPSKGAVDDEKLRHLHFEVLFSQEHVDPGPVMPGWERKT
jgi:murein DD-endopeptidase MepM/ murein hydrolase activator NlpD